MKKRRFVFVVLASFMTFQSFALAADKTLQPPPDSATDVSNIYRDMIVVQRKAKVKAGSVLFQAYWSKEFSDGPAQIQSASFGLGYAFSDHFEVYVAMTPAFTSQDSQIKKDVEKLDLANGKKAELLSPDPKTAVYLQLYWLPAYGKDSWGPFSIVRSDTFFRFQGGTISYDGENGSSFGLGVGKTFFFGRFFNPRFVAAVSSQQTIVNTVKQTSFVGSIELGSVWYF